jgi:hypothetical protein
MPPDLLLPTGSVRPHKFTPSEADSRSARKAWFSDDRFDLPPDALTPERFGDQGLVRPDERITMNPMAALAALPA